MDESDWDAILMALYDGTLIPIIGRELMPVALPTGEAESFDCFLAREFAKGEKLEWRDRDAASFYARQRRHFLEEPKAERRLAALHDKLVTTTPSVNSLAPLLAGGRTRLWLTTTTDGFLARSLSELIRTLPGHPELQEHSSSRQGPADLPDRWYSENAIHLVYLLGRINAMGASYARTDADTLEYLLQMQTPEYKPVNLFAALGGKGIDREEPKKPVPTHLLFLGHSFPDWLARLFHRTIRGFAFTDTQQREGFETIADSGFVGEPDEKPLIFFFYHFCRATVRYDGTPAQFLADLSTRWDAYLAARNAPPAGIAEADYRMPTGSIFISYTRDDSAAAEAVYQDLTGVGLDAWFDRARLRVGTAWSNAIEQNIKTCDLFVPLISSNTERKSRADSRDGGFFLREWRLGLRRTLSFGKARPFICPLIVDDNGPAAFSSTSERLEDDLPPLADWQFLKAPGGSLRVPVAGGPGSVLDEIKMRLKQIRS